jgi:hypothetical protein
MCIDFLLVINSFQHWIFITMTIYIYNFHYYEQKFEDSFSGAERIT